MNKSYEALYRRFRPHTFPALVGQEHVARTLSRAIETGKVSHAYLFCGPRGTGKTSVARILAAALNCTDGPTPEPCGKCDACKSIAGGYSTDVIEIDAASNRGVDEIRRLKESTHYVGSSRARVYIVDEVHMLTSEAFNALLKTLEEPEQGVYFILATTEANKVPPTIQSRCQRFDFHRITVADIRKHLRHVCQQVGVEAEDSAIELIALQADGGMRDALSILDQCISLADGTVTEAGVQSILGLVGHSWIYRLTEALAQNNAQECLSVVDELLHDGKDLKQVLSELEVHLRSLMIYQAAGTVEGLDLYAEPEDVLKKQSRFWNGKVIMKMIARLHEALTELRWTPQPRISVEVALLSIARRQFAKKGIDERMDEEERMGVAEKHNAPAIPTTQKIQNKVSAPSGKDAAFWKKIVGGFAPSTKACLAQATFDGVSDGKFCLSFSSPALANIVSTRHAAIEQALAESFGNVQLVCTTKAR